MRESVNSQILGTQTLVTNAINNTQLQNLLKEYGFTPARMQEATVLLNNVQAKQNEKEEYYSQQAALASRLREENQRMRDTYHAHLNLARFAFRGDVTQQKWLELDGPRKTKTNDYLGQAKKFYTRIQPLVPQLKKFGLTEAEFTQGQAQVEAVISIRQQWINGKGAAEQATQQRNEALIELHNWVVRFRQIARTACYDQPQLLESLGMNS